MKNLSRQLQSPDQKIEDIITALETYALGDIKYNIYGIDDCEKKEPKPIAAFILSSCLIDQAAAFAYNPDIGENEQSYKRFIREFMPVYYQPLNLYTDLRNLLIHGYSVGEYISLTLETELSPIDERNISAIHISVNRLYEDLKGAIKKLKEKLLSDTDIRKAALEKFDKNPPLIEAKHGFLRYTRKGADYLVNLYKEQLIGKYMNENPAWKIANVTRYQYNPPETWYFVLCVAIYSQHRHTMHLDKITQQVGLLYPTEVLNSAGLKTEYSLLEY